MADPEKPFDQQIQFARHNFENHQALIRFSDTKAGAMITLFVFLAASGLQIIKEAGQATHFKPCRVALLSILLVVSCLGLVGAFLRCLWSVLQFFAQEEHATTTNPLLEPICFGKTMWWPTVRTAHILTR
jgi:hypothetical protein